MKRWHLLCLFTAFACSSATHEADYEAAWWATVEVADEAYPDIDLFEAVKLDWEATTVLEVGQSEVDAVPGCKDGVACNLVTHVPGTDVYAHVILILHTLDGKPTSAAWRCRRMVHESLHSIHRRLYGTGDGDHSNPWFWEDYGKDTLEYQAEQRAIGVCAHE